MTIRINSRLVGNQQTLRHTSQNKEKLDKSLEKLSSGKRVNSAGDDASALAMAEKMSSALKSVEQSQRNVFDGLSVAKVADGAIDQVHQYLGRMKELGVAAANETLSEDQRAALQTEFDSLRSEVDRISGGTEFNGQRLLDGSSGQMDIAVGEGESVQLDLGAPMDSASLGLDAASLGGADGSNARAALEDIDAAMERVGSFRAELGATSNRLESAGRNLAIQAENTYAARSRLVDADMALEASNRARHQILTQAGVAVQAQAKGLSANVLNLLE